MSAVAPGVSQSVSPLRTRGDTSIKFGERHGHDALRHPKTFLKEKVKKTEQTIEMPPRLFGMLRIYVIQGNDIINSWVDYRKRHAGSNKTTALTCGFDPLGCNTSPDVCMGKADPYVTVELADEATGESYVVGSTYTIDNNHEPRWNHEFSSLLDHLVRPGSDPTLRFKVYDDDFGGESYSDELGEASVPFSRLLHKTQKNDGNSPDLKPYKLELTVRHPGSGSKVSKAKLQLELRWIPLAVDPDSYHVPQTYFRRSHGNRVRLYGDADFLGGQCPPVQQQQGVFTPAKAWEELHGYLLQARHIILIAGWSVNPDIPLVRDYTIGEHGQTLGEVLIQKANEGALVCVMVWDDVTSTGSLNETGLMATFDEKTRKYFAGTKVKTILAKRTSADDVQQVPGVLRWTSFTHHQKIVVMDTPHPFNNQAKRVLTAFVGGLDLTSGRYDTPAHDLFRTLETAHKNDFYNGCIPTASQDVGPREPWHDIHGMIQGPGAWDVLQTYMERVQKQGAPNDHPDFEAHVHKLIDRQVLTDGSKVLVGRNDPSGWDVQVFRSMDSEAAVFRNEAWMKQFGNDKLYVDRGIQQAYCCLIDKAKGFIYIENQYFLGSAQRWLEHRDVPCYHQVPYALTQRICRAIADNEDFSVYVLIPLFPEGDPSSASVQEILHWQYQTVRMMYSTIASQLNSSPLKGSKKPTDYLSFFFVGKREPDAIVTDIPAGATADLRAALTHKRHPIYVHSKMMLIDDEYVLMGSANINERSMAGCRDTEIAFGALQTGYRTTGSKRSLQYPEGDVRGFRKTLWHEHMGRYLPEFDRPERCARTVRELAEQNYQAYSDNENILQMPYGHLCLYPYEVNELSGTVTARGNGNLPGFQSPLCGVRSAILPKPLTT